MPVKDYLDLVNWGEEAQLNSSLHLPTCEVWPAASGSRHIVFPTIKDCTLKLWSDINPSLSFFYQGVLS